MKNWIKSVLGITDIEEKQDILDAELIAFKDALNVLDVDVDYLLASQPKPKRKKVAK